MNEGKDWPVVEPGELALRVSEVRDQAEMWGKLSFSHRPNRRGLYDRSRRLRGRDSTPGRVASRDHGADGCVDSGRQLALPSFVWETESGVL